MTAEEMAEKGLGDLPFIKPEDMQYFGELLNTDKDEASMSPAELKSRVVMRCLHKIKNGTPPQRKTALRYISDHARELGPEALFDQVGGKRSFLCSFPSLSSLSSLLSSSLLFSCSFSCVVAVVVAVVAVGAAVTTAPPSSSRLRQFYPPLSALRPRLTPSPSPLTHTHRSFPFSCPLLSRTKRGTTWLRS